MRPDLRLPSFRSPEGGGWGEVKGLNNSRRKIEDKPKKDRTLLRRRRDHGDQIGTRLARGPETLDSAIRGRSGARVRPFTSYGAT